MKVTLLRHRALHYSWLSQWLYSDKQNKAALITYRRGSEKGLDYKVELGYLIDNEWNEDLFGYISLKKYARNKKFKTQKQAKTYMWKWFKKNK